jgi:AcrR family transcriptional regulator
VERVTLSLMSAPAPARKRLTAEERRGAILDSAGEVFAQRGYHGSSIDDIARNAGISKALIYEHFDSKQELYASLLEENAGELFRRLAAAVPEAEEGGAARLASGLDAFFGFVEERRDAWRMLFREAADPEVAAAVGRVVAQVTTVVAALIAEDPGADARVEEEAEPDEAIEMLAQMIVGAMQTIANWWADHQEVSREQIVSEAMDFAWLGLDRVARGERWRDLHG